MFWFLIGKKTDGHRSVDMVMLTDLCVMARPMSLLSVCGEFLCMVISV